MRAKRGFWKGLKTFATPEQARIIRNLIERKISPIDSQFPGTAVWYHACYHPPKLAELVLSAIDEVLNNFGVESAEIKGRYYDYSNKGDTYATTVFQRNGIFWADTLGDLVERLESGREEYCE